MAAGLCLASSLAADSNLISESPFLPPGWSPAKPPVVQVQPQAAPPVLARQLEFKGVVDLGNGQQFSLFDKKSGESYWLPLNEMRDGFQVVRYEPNRASIYIRSGGRTEELRLATVDESPMQIASGVSTSVTASSTPTRPNIAPTTPNSGNAQAGPVIPRRRIIEGSPQDDGGKPPQNGGSQNPLPPPPGA